MAPVLELDRQTVSFVRQLEEQRKLEKTLLVERVRGTKEGLESVFSDIKGRVEVLEKLKGSASAGYNERVAPDGHAHRDGIFSWEPLAVLFVNVD